MGDIAIQSAIYMINIYGIRKSMTEKDHPKGVCVSKPMIRLNCT